ncbi:Eukaryotic translation initiation factor 4E type 2 [Rhizoclosmatium sp. JEL0117]|nr:Eukaryotic translation initiation factor 4E type 2 [Rhizoclosmatium sp. JEL0117]
MHKEPKRKDPQRLDSVSSVTSTTTGVETAGSGSESKGPSYSDSITKVCTFSTVAEFWMGYSHVKRPSDLAVASDLFLFKDGLRPTWEDQPTGGKWIVRLKKGLASRYWVLALIGEQFDVGDEICGAVISMRHQEDILSVWNQTAESGRVNLKIRDTLKRVLNLPSNCIMEYKAHQASITDQSSYRNTALFL